MTGRVAARLTMVVDAGLCDVAWWCCPATPTAPPTPRLPVKSNHSAPDGKGTAERQDHVRTTATLATPPSSPPSLERLLPSSASFCWVLLSSITPNPHSSTSHSRPVSSITNIYGMGLASGDKSLSLPGWCIASSCSQHLFLLGCCPELKRGYRSFCDHVHNLAI